MHSEQGGKRNPKIRLLETPPVAVGATDGISKFYRPFVKLKVLAIEQLQQICTNIDAKMQQLRRETYRVVSQRLRENKQIISNRSYKHYGIESIIIQESKYSLRSSISIDIKSSKTQIGKEDFIQRLVQMTTKQMLQRLNGFFVVFLKQQERIKEVVTKLYSIDDKTPGFVDTLKYQLIQAKLIIEDHSKILLKTMSVISKECPAIFKGDFKVKIEKGWFGY